MSHVNHFDASLWQTCDSLYEKGQLLYLKLQDDYGLNVNLLLLAQWLDEQHYYLSDQDWRQLSEQVETWEQKVLKPYRRLRKLSKHNLAEAEYRQMLEVELMLERKSQGMILRQLRQLPSEQGQANLPRYLGLFQIEIDKYHQLAQTLTRQA
ncbi:TIGR02444 family protein [Shewanella insulae]|uniref:TIGR02444 family protein n=1 Tax=Shewanella insulae TaxID=2681496 RepID=A0A6L7HZK4_9GAMM|nr:TIGR02444 family protein [Shewanella insulae]MXR69749.1 TIGR02444 family protein [Shewanella insulae]